MTAFVRNYPLEDITIRSGGDGRTVEAYAAVFNVDTEIHDHQGNTWSGSARRRLTAPSPTVGHRSACSTTTA